jgi:hypothetical protein
VADKRVSEPESELTRLITDIVDKILRNRRFRPIPARAAMSKREFAISLGVGISTVEGAIRDGELEAVKIGHRTIITPEARESYLASRPRIRPTTASAESEFAPTP